MITVLSSNFKTEPFVVPFEQSVICNTKNLSRIIIATQEPIETQMAETPIFKIKVKQGSENHGTILNKIVPKVETEYTLLMDIDCFLYQKNWDEILIPMLDKYTLIGARAFREDSKTKTKMLHANFIFGKTKDFQGIDFRPNFNQNIDTAGNLTLAHKNKNILHIDYTYSTVAFLGIPRCVEYKLKGSSDPIWYHFSRGGQRVDDPNVIKWNKCAKEVLGY